MKLTTRIDRLERRAGIGEPLKLTIAFCDSVLNETISDEEFESLCRRVTSDSSRPAWHAC
jgi:hypothetical protein